MTNGVVVNWHIQCALEIQLWILIQGNNYITLRGNLRMGATKGQPLPNLLVKKPMWIVTLFRFFYSI